MNDRYLRTFLGGMDKNWLAYILEESESTDFAIHQNHNLIGVAGIQESELDLQYIITNFCINPNLKIDEIGSKVLNQLLAQYDMDDLQTWLTFVHRQNDSGVKLFENNGWKFLEAEEDLLTYQFSFLNNLPTRLSL